MDLHHRRATRGALTVLAVAGIGFTVPLLQASADASPTAACLDAGNVWVLVETDEAVEGGCATDFATGLEALASAGFQVQADDSGFITTIDGAPTDRGAQDWWAYAHTDADLGAWQFYEVGAALSQPAAGSIEGWRLIHSWDDTDTFPSLTPGELLAEVDATPTVSASPSADPSTTSSPTPSVSSSGTPSPTPVPSETAVGTRPTPSLPNTGN